MMMEDKAHLSRETIETLNELIRINMESSKGLEQVAAEVGDPHLKSMFEEIAPERRANAEELKPFVHWSTEKPETAPLDEGGSFSETAHQWWTGLRDKLARNDCQAVLEQAERGEDAIKHTYEAVLTRTAGSAVNDVLQRQYAGVKRGHDRIRDLRDRFAREEK